MKPPIHVVMNRLQPFSSEHKLAHLKALIELERKRSIRRAELEAAAKDVRRGQLAMENALAAAMAVANDFRT